MMWKYRILWTLFCLMTILLSLPSSSFSAQGRRTALVIGNAAYQSARLQNPSNDARDMANALKDLGFEVILKVNAGRREIDIAVEEFYQNLNRARVGLFYYAGHGMQIDRLKLDKGKTVAEMDLEPLRQKLHNKFRDEFEPTRAVKRLEESIRRAARAQRLISLLAIHNLIMPVGYTEDDNFYTVLRNHLDHPIEERDQLLITDLSVRTLKAIEQDLLFDVSLPSVGERTPFTLPIHFVSAAVDLGCRLADSLRMNRAQLTVGVVKRRIERELEKEVRSIRDG